MNLIEVISKSVSNNERIYIGEKLKKADYLTYKANELLSEAKRDVEDLIEGKLNNDNANSKKTITWDHIEKKLEEI